MNREESLGITKEAQEYKDRVRYLGNLLGDLIESLEAQLDQLSAYYNYSDKIDMQNLGSWEAITKSYEQCEDATALLSKALNDTQGVYIEKLKSEKRLS